VGGRLGSGTSSARTPVSLADATAPPLRRHEGQALTPASTRSLSEHPQDLVPYTKTNACPRPTRPREDGKLVALERFSVDYVVARAHPDSDGCEQEPEEFKHASASLIHGRPTFALPQPQPASIARMATR
jgi:hypothetical protein